MRLWEVSLVCILYLSIVGYRWSQGNEGSDFLDYKEEQIRRIANLARANDEKKCELVRSCANPTECSRAGCSPRKADVLECASVLNNYRCIENATCNNIRVNFERSYVRYPKLDYVDSESVTEEMRDSICSQRMLDPLFVQMVDEQLKKNENSSEDYYFNFYFGSVDGTFRFYPGLEVRDCSAFDPRKRPWYLGAISVKKDIVVLLDKGSSMDTEYGNTFTTTSGRVAGLLTQNLLETLTSNDRATVITFDSSQASLLRNPFEVPLRGLNSSDPEFKNLLLSVNATANARPGDSNYTAAVLKAASTLSGSAPSSALKIIVVFTGSESTAVPTEAQRAAIAKELEDQSIRLFIYEISDPEKSRLGSTDCTSPQVYHENLDTLGALQNPLFSLDSYFTYLARSNIDSLPSPLSAYWQPIYRDYGNLGDVITVAYPVMSRDNLRLIGVAGIDIQTSGLRPILQSQVEESLKSRRSIITSNILGANFTTCDAGLEPQDDGCKVNGVQATCPKDDDRSTYKDLVCCGECLVDGEKNSRAALIISVVSVVSALGLAAVGLVLYFRFCRPAVRPPPIVDIVKVPEFSYEQLFLATNRFSESNRLGKGTFGVVYVGTLTDGKRVAVKKLHFKPDHDLKNFEAEIRVMATANHNNLLALKGFCVDQYCILVYELLENGDLDSWLFDKPASEVLPWAQRVVVAKGTARGLAYLHEELQNDQKVCHSDIKPANILLDKDFNPKVADFGMAKLYGRGDDLYANGGTLGYMAPEILNGALADTKADVYSYGMVLLELVTGRRFSDFKTQSLRYWASIEVAEGRERDIVDPRLKNMDENDHAAARTLLNIALNCTLIVADSRPDMSAVVKMIDGSLPVPLPFSHERPHELDLSSETTDQSGESFQWEGSWTMTQVLSRFQSNSSKERKTAG